MGIAELNSFLKSKNILPKQYHLSQLKGRIGIDVSNLLCRYKYSGKICSMAYNIYKIISNIRKHGACAIFIFDGKNNEDKKEECDRRRRARLRLI